MIKIIFWLCLVIFISCAAWVIVYQLSYPDKTPTRIMFDNWKVYVVMIPCAIVCFVMYDKIKSK